MAPPTERVRTRSDSRGARSAATRCRSHGHRRRDRAWRGRLVRQTRFHVHSRTPQEQRPTEARRIDAWVPLWAMEDRAGVADGVDVVGARAPDAVQAL